MKVSFAGGSLFCTLNLKCFGKSVSISTSLIPSTNSKCALSKLMFSSFAQVSFSCLRRFFSCYVTSIWTLSVLNWLPFMWVIAVSISVLILFVAVLVFMNLLMLDRCFPTFGTENFAVIKLPWGVKSDPWLLLGESISPSSERIESLCDIFVLLLGSGGLLNLLDGIIIFARLLFIEQSKLSSIYGRFIAGIVTTESALAFVVTGKGSWLLSLPWEELRASKKLSTL